MEDGEAETFGEDFDGGPACPPPASGGAVGLGVDADDLRSTIGEGPEGGDGEVGGTHEDAARIWKV